MTAKKINYTAVIHDHIDKNKWGGLIKYGTVNKEGNIVQNAHEACHGELWTTARFVDSEILYSWHPLFHRGKTTNEQAIIYRDWMESPSSPWHSLNKYLYHGDTWVMSAHQPANLMMNFLIASRHLWDTQCKFSLQAWIELLDIGINPNLAYLLVDSVHFPSGDFHGEWSWRTLDSNHDVLDLHHLGASAVRNLLNGTPANLNGTFAEKVSNVRPCNTIWHGKDVEGPYHELMMELYKGDVAAKPRAFNPPSTWRDEKGEKYRYPQFLEIARAEQKRLCA